MLTFSLSICKHSKKILGFMCMAYTRALTLGEINQNYVVLEL